ncbi:MAG: CHAP domain-containing protein [Ruminococcus sp.]|nr:CHAP domain-containing protein [Ruminococcus sp.]
MTTAAKVFMMLRKNKTANKIIGGIVAGIVFLILIIPISLLQIQQSTRSSALAEQAKAEFSYWQGTTPEETGYTCQGERYCSHFNASVVDWCCYFVGTCADNAGLDLYEIGFSPSTNTWASNLSEKGKLKTAGAYSPQVGNLIFFNYDGRSNYAATGFVSHIGIVVEINNNQITVIAGNEYNGATENWANVSYVNEYTLSIDDDSIACYGAVGSDIVASSELSELTRDIISHNEIGVLYSEIDNQYGSVIPNDVGAISVGVYGWHGNKALEILKRAYQINQLQIYSVALSYSGGNSVLTDITSSADWSAYIPDSDESSCIKAMLLTDSGKQAQDETSIEDAQQYIDICTENGLTDKKVIAYCSDILNQFGVNSFYANVYGTGRNGVLYGVNSSTTLYDVYNSGRAWSDSNYNYESRRTWTYEYLKDY